MLYCEGMAVQVKTSFNDLLSVASLSPESHPIEWVVAHLEGVIESCREYRTDCYSRWLEDCLNWLPVGPDPWDWHAPRFVLMEPLGVEPFVASELWDMLEVDESDREARRFAYELFVRLKQAVHECALAASSALSADLTDQGSPKRGYAKELDRESQAGRHEPPWRFGADFRSVTYNGIQHSLTRPQGTMMRVLLEAYSSGHPVVDKDTLLRSVDAETSQVRNFWRKSPLWKTLISSPRKGAYQLARFT